MDERAIDLLKEIGLGKIEVDVYLDLLKARASTATEIAKRIKYHRPNVYDAIRRLEQKGFVNERLEGERRVFEANPPSVIFSYLQQKKSEIQDVLPYLESMTSKKTETETVSVSYGVTKVRESLYDIYKTEHEVIIWGSPKKVEDILGKAFIDEITKERIKKKIPAKILYSGKIQNIKSDLNHGLVQNAKGNLKPLLKEIRYIDEDTNSATIIISGDKVLILVYLERVMIIEMKGEVISNWFRSQFNFVWEKAKNPESIRNGKKKIYEIIPSVVKKELLSAKGRKK